MDEALRREHHDVLRIVRDLRRRHVKTACVKYSVSIQSRRSTA